MNTIFVSCQDISSEPAQSLIEKLKAEGFRIEHSPKNPLHGQDERWITWYDELLPKTIEHVVAFVVVLDSAWDSSTWMAIESAQAMHRTPKLPMFAYNPQQIKVIAPGMAGYVQEQLPPNASDAVSYIVQRLK